MERHNNSAILYQFYNVLCYFIIKMLPLFVQYDFTCNMYHSLQQMLLKPPFVT